MWIGQAQRATASGERIFQVIDEPEEVTDRPGAGELPPGGGHIRFEGVGFEYMPGRPVLEGIDLDVPPGRTIALIGHTGSGKTTLTSLVPRFYDVTAGRVTIDGADVRDVKLALAPERDRRDLPGHVPLLGHGAREHHLRRPGSERRGGRARRHGLPRRTSSSNACRRGSTQ